MSVGSGHCTQEAVTSSHTTCLQFLLLLLGPSKLNTWGLQLKCHNQIISLTVLDLYRCICVIIMMLGFGFMVNSFGVNLF